MTNLIAHAFRKGKNVLVRIQGNLPDSCHEIKVDGTYPGNIVHIVDPGHAEVFLKIVKKEDVDICTDALVPFLLTVQLNDEIHKEVRVTIDSLGEITVPINKTNEYIVLNMIGGFVPGPHYSIVPEDFEIIPHLYEKSFGPDSYENCTLFIQNHSIRFLSGGDGGSGAPRG